LVGTEVSESSSDVSDSLGVIISTSPWLDDKSSSVSDWAVFETKDVATTGEPSDDTISFVKVEHFSFVVLWHGQDSSVLVSSDVVVDGDDSVATHSRLNLESLAVLESNVPWNSWEVLDLPLLVCTVVAFPVSGLLVLSVLRKIDSESHVSSVVESGSSSVVVDRLLSGSVSSHDESLTLTDTLVVLVGNSIGSA